jgi:hypothetical protein
VISCALHELSRVSEKERKAYYNENPEHVPKWEETKKNNRIEKKKVEKERNMGLVETVRSSETCFHVLSLTTALADSFSPTGN